MEATSHGRGSGGTLVVWDEGLLGYDLGDHPLDPVRLELTIALAGSLGVLDRPGVTVVKPQPADDEALLDLAMLRSRVGSRPARRVAVVSVSGGGGVAAPGGGPQVRACRSRGRSGGVELARRPGAPGARAGGAFGRCWARGVCVRPIGEALAFGRNLANRSANDLYPETMAEIARSLEAENCAVEVLGPTEMADLFPWARTDDLLAGFHVPGDGRVNPVDVTTALAKGARRLGVRIVEGVSVEDVLTDRGRGA